MNTNFLEILLNWPKPYISGSDLLCILDKSDDSRQAIIRRSVKCGYLSKIRNDLYLIKNSQRATLNAFEIALIIYGPSYVSFESALSYHGWIPEAVRTITCASVKKFKEFETIIGVFSYEHIPIKAFFCGVNQYLQDELTLFIASPLKALADIIYARNQTWESLDALCEDLRIDIDIFKNSDKQLLIEIIENHPNKTVQTIFNTLLKEMS